MNWFYEIFTVTFWIRASIESRRRENSKKRTIQEAINNLLDLYISNLSRKVEKFSLTKLYSSCNSDYIQVPGGLFISLATKKNHKTLKDFFSTNSFRSWL